MKLIHSIAIASVLAFSAPAFAQTPAPAPAAPAAAPAMPAAKPAAKPRSAKSMECSKQADSQNLHGKARHKFMGTCKKS